MTIEANPAPRPTFFGVLRATSVLGVASIASMTFGVLRSKVFALLVGPAGVGIYGTLQSIQAFSITLADMGLTGAGAREFAMTASDEGEFSRVKYVLVRLALVLGIGVAIALVLFRTQLARFAFGDAKYATDVGILGVGVTGAALGGAAGALLMGTHRVRAFATAKIWAAVGATALAIPAVYFFRENGLSIALVAIPVSTFFFSWLAARPMFERARAATSVLRGPEARRLLRFGGGAVLAVMAASGTQLLVRSFLVNRFKLSVAGEFQAAWSISMLYSGVVLSAVQADFFPRASAAAHDATGLAQMALVQVRAALTLAVPMAAGIALLSHIVVPLVYSGAFTQSITILRFHVIGDPLRIMWWVLSLGLLAAGNVRAYVMVEGAWNAAYLLLVMFISSVFGTKYIGMAFPMAYLIAAPLLLALAPRAFRMASVWKIVALAGAAALLVALGAAIGTTWWGQSGLHLLRWSHS